MSFNKIDIALIVSVSPLVITIFVKANRKQKSANICFAMAYSYYVIGRYVMYVI